MATISMPPAEENRILHDAGNKNRMNRASSGDLKAMLAGLKEGLVTRRQLMINATRVIRMARKLTGEGDK